MTKSPFNSNCVVSSPCKDCKERQLGCHGQCKHYAEYRQKIETIDTNRAKYTENRVQKYQRINDLNKRKEHGCVYGSIMKTHKK